MSGWVALFLAIAANVAANISFKYFISNTELRMSWPSVVGAVAQPSLWIGVGLGVCLLALYLYSLRTIPLAVAYTAATSLSIAGIASAGVLLYGEAIGLRTAVGIAIVMLGVVLMVTG